MVTEITQPGLATYHNDKYFFVRNGAVVCRCPVNGATTPGSSYPRTELRQMKNNGQTEVAWSNANAEWSMEAIVAFTELPPNGKTVVGMQIHDDADDITVLRLEDSDLWVTKGNTSHHKKILSGYTLGTKLNMKVVAEKGSGIIRWYRDGVFVAKVDHGTPVTNGYFKCGCYVQANSGGGHGEVEIYALNVAKVA